MSLRQQILSANDLRRRLVSVPEWDAQVYVRTLTGTERDAFEAAISSGGKQVNLIGMRARLAVATVCDGEGNRIFKDSDVEALGRKSAKALSRIFDVASALNGLSESDVEDLVGNSGGEPIGVSSSGSPSPLERPSDSSLTKSTPAS